MSKVEIEKRGKVARVHPRLADMLVQRYGYLRRDLQAQQLMTAPAGPVAAPPPRRAKKKPNKKTSDSASPAEGASE
ncbi:hypothetical protein Xmlh_17370 [Xanthomonas axonopodis pv. melhusii]|uniref:Uncharacterized protein n=1 Tax=Xanthomonas axonopodis pv. melhusii TaxID=487834 RepID=A0A1T1NVQ8_9XANT|nr:hypothetical protein [Xanthomonas axonopodis]OOW67434.1 hypothetical protein Xmlh_17370 [Xanthomonas axonopodis pv. melhusii]